MYELVEEAMKVLREPTDDFDFDNPPEDPKEIEKNLAEAMERFGGTWINPTASQTTVVGITSGAVEPISDNQIRANGSFAFNPGRMEDLGARIALGNIDLVNGTITFT